MKNGRVVRKPEVNQAFRARLLMVCFLFVLGTVFGMLAHGVVTAQDDQNLQAYILQFAQDSGKSGDNVALIVSVMTTYFRYPVLAFACSFVAAGLVLVPLLCLTQGFFLSFSVCCFASALGQSGVALALAALGVRCLVTLPCTFYLSAQSLTCAYDRLQRTRQKDKLRVMPDVWPTLQCCLILLLGVAAELYAVPKLIQLVLTGI